MSTRKIVAIENWVNSNLHGEPVKVKDMSNYIPIRINAKTTIYVDPLDKEKLENIKKKYGVALTYLAI